MNEQQTEEPSIVAASPIVHETGMLLYRIVIRDLGDQHVVHTQVFEPGKEPWYHQGDYFPKGERCANRRGVGRGRTSQGLGSLRGAGAAVTANGTAAGQEAGRGVGHRRVDHQRPPAR